MPRGNRIVTPNVRILPSITCVFLVIEPTYRCYPPAVVVGKVSWQQAKNPWCKISRTKVGKQRQGMEGTLPQEIYFSGPSRLR